MRTKWLFHRFNLLVITKKWTNGVSVVFRCSRVKFIPSAFARNYYVLYTPVTSVTSFKVVSLQLHKKNNLVRLWLVRCCNVFHFRTFISLRGESKVSVHYMVKGKQVSWSLIELQLLLKTKKRKRRQSLLICTACSFALSWLPLIR